MTNPTPPTAESDVVVIGAGLAATALVAALRAEGFGGQITILGDEGLAPYDRPPLSKELFTRDAPADLREQFGLRGDAAAWLTGRAVAITPLARGASVAWGGADLAAPHVVVAVGARPFHPPGWAGARTLSTWPDAVELRAELDPGAHLLVAGAGWVGLELAAAAAGAGVRVTVVEESGRPLGQLLPPPVGERFAAWLTAAGVKLVAGRVTAASGTRLTLTDGRGLAGEAVVAALGARPATGWLPPAWLTPTGHIRVDAAGAVVDAGPGVWAIGDCAAVGRPDQHWNAAVAAAGRCARAIVGRPVGEAPPAHVFSTMFGHQVDLVGVPTPGADVTLRADDRGWTALLERQGVLTAGVVVDRPRDVGALRRVLAAPAPRLDHAIATDPARRLTDSIR